MCGFGHIQCPSMWEVKNLARMITLNFAIRLDASPAKRSYSGSRFTAQRGNADTPDAQTGLYPLADGDPDLALLVVLVVAGYRRRRTSRLTGVSVNLRLRRELRGHVEAGRLGRSADWVRRLPRERRRFVGKTRLRHLEPRHLFGRPTAVFWVGSARQGKVLMQARSTVASVLGALLALASFTGCAAETTQ